MSISINNIYLQFKKSAFIKNMLIVMSGTAIAQVIGFALTPVISRLFTPSDFGIFGSFNAVLNVFSAGVTLEYSQAIILPKDKNDALHLFLISIVSSSLVTVLFAIICIINPFSVMGVIKAPNAWILALLILAILVTGVNTSLQSWCIRIKAFNKTSSSQIIRSLTSNSLQIGFGFLKTGSLGLIISNVLAEIFASINLFRVLLVDLKKSFRNITLLSIKKLAKEYVDFPLYSASQGVINALSSGLPILLLAHFYDIAIAGAYAFGMRLLSAPMGLVTRALKQVLFQKAAETHQQGGKLLRLYTSSTIVLFSIAIMPSLILFIWSPDIFDFIFGHQWTASGEYAGWLVLWLLFVFCNAPAALFGRIIRIQQKIFIYDMLLLVTRVIVLLIGGVYLSALQSIAIFSIAGAIMNFFLILLVGYNVKHYKAHNVAPCP